MVSALFYLQFTSLWNRTAKRLKRLRQPKYFLGAIVGGAYFYFYFVRYLFGFGKSTAVFPLTASVDNRVLFEGLAAGLLMVVVVLAWILPRNRATLTFTEAEVAFLFPAPLTRRGLIHYKLLRSQLGILFTSIFLMLLSNRVAGNFWVHALGWWLVLSTLNLHLLGASFARTMLLDRGITHWQRRAAVLLVLVVGAAMVLVWARRTLPYVDLAELRGPEQLKQYCRELLASGPVPWLLAPFRWVIRPYVAQSALEFLRALVPSLVLLGIHYVWVIRANVTFEEASVEASQKLAERVAAVRSGNWHASRQAQKARRAPFELRPAGPTLVAIFWKNLISAGQAFTWRLWLILAIMGGAGAVAFGQNARYSNVAVALMFLIGMFLFWSLLLGPQLLRQDFRQDLALAEVLKMYPLRAWELATGELLAPAVILTAIQWGLLLVGLLLLGGKSLPGIPASLLLAIGSSLAISLPPLNLLTLQIPNAAVLLFPAWFQPGKEGPQGIEATGQRILFMLGQIFAFFIAVLPAAIAGGLVGFGLHFVAALPLAVFAGAACASVVLLGEAVLGLVLLGKLFERLDISADPLT